MVQTGVLLKAICYQTLLNNPNKIKVEGCVHDGEEDLFHAVPNFVDMYVLLTDLKASRNPDTENADVDGQEDCEASPLEYSSISTDNHEQADSVDDNLNQTLNLYRPKYDDKEVILETGFYDPTEI